MTTPAVLPMLLPFFTDISVFLLFELIMMYRPLNSRKQSGEKEMEVWNQIRRTEEESMERGTMENALLHEHRVGTERVVRSVEALRRIVA